jgi:ketosteroid isomerase-like protein
MQAGRLAGSLRLVRSGNRVSVLLQAESGDMPSDASTMGERLVTRLQAAMNAHDLEAFVACFVEDYDSVQPAHPDRAFRGREQVRANWSAVFSGVPDFRAELVGVNAVGDTAWSEWRWQGTQIDGGRLDMAGVIVFGVRDDRVRGRACTSSRSSKRAQASRRRCVT